MASRLITVIPFLATLIAPLSSQPVAGPDPMDSLAKDTVVADSLVPDTMPKQQPRSADTVNYSADIILYNREDSILTLVGNAELVNKGLQLKSDTIIFYTNKRYLEAKGTPMIVDQGDVIVGEKMSYLMDEKKGKVTYGTARSKGDVYNGEIIGRMEDNTFLIKNGDFSTCTIDTTPHFFFFSKRMKIIPSDKIVARPLVLNIGDVPVGVLPYFIVPIKRGRQSGLLTPRWGEFSDNGNRASYLNNVGYYFAISDYTDLETKMDFTNGDGFFFKRIYLNSIFNYKKRYWLDGHVNGRMDISRSEEALSRNWGVSYNHSHNIFPDQSFLIRGSGELVGNSNFYRMSTLRREDYLKRRLRSNMAVVKNWREQGLSANMDFRYEEDLDSKENSMNLPSFSFSSIQRSLPFCSRESQDGPVPADSLKWYEKIKYSYGTRGVNVRKKTLEERFDVLDTTFKDTSSYLRQYSAKDARHDLRLNISPAPRISHININPFLSVSSHWFFKEKQSRGDSIVELNYRNIVAFDTLQKYDTVPAFNHDEEYRTGLNLSTQLFGISMLNLGRLTGFRHILQPNIGYTFSPELKGWEKYISAGTTNNRDREEQQNIGFGANNTFQVKIAGDPESKNPQDKTITLLNLNASTGYNFKGKNKAGEETGRWSDLTSSASTNLYALGLQYSGSHTFYNDNDEFIPKKEGITLRQRLPRLQSYRLSASTGARLSGKFSGGDIRAGFLGPDTAGMNPWSLVINFNYSYNSRKNETFNVFEKNSSFSLRDNFALNFTKNWQMSYSSIYDFKNNELVDQSIDLLRDFHCWEATFHWVISGYRAGFYFKINIKKIPDVKFEKRGGQMGSFIGSGMYYPGQGSIF
jgi:hypothetical protein